MTTPYGNACFTLPALFISGISVTYKGGIRTLEHAKISNHTEKIEFDDKGFQQTNLKLTWSAWSFCLLSRMYLQRSTTSSELVTLSGMFFFNSNICHFKVLTCWWKGIKFPSNNLSERKVQIKIQLLKNCPSVWNKTCQPLNEMEAIHNHKFHTVIANSIGIFDAV